MPHLKSACVLLAAFVLPAAALAAGPTGEAKLEKLIEGRTAGKPSDCLPLMGGSPSSTKIEGVGEVFGSGRTIYVNRFEGGCPGLSSFDTIVTRSPQGRLCRGDIARIVDLTSRIERGSCVLGPFVPYSKAK